MISQSFLVPVGLRAVSRALPAVGPAFPRRSGTLSRTVHHAQVARRQVHLAVCHRALEQSFLRSLWLWH